MTLNKSIHICSQHGLLVLLLACATQLAWAQSQLPDFTGLVQQSAPAVVNIETIAFGSRPESQSSEDDAMPPGMPEDMPEFFRRFFDPRGEGFGRGQPDRRSGGSGFFITKDGYLVTNHHVVDGADEIVVRLEDRREYEAKLVGSDEASDIAVLKVEAEEDFPFLRLGDSTSLQRGEWVFAIGSPFSFEQTVTAGIVSGKGRQNARQQYVPFIQSDVAINRGNSGGPLLNMQGEVVGINSWILSNSGGYIGLSFSIPSEIAQNSVQQLRDKGYVSRGLLGVGIELVSRETADAFGLDRPRGALVNRLEPDGAAEQAGIEVGDIILEFNGEPINVFGELPPMVGTTPPGTKVKLKVFRDGKMKTLTATITELDNDAVASTAGDSDEQVRSNVLGLAVESISDERRERLGNPEGGVIITEVESDTAYRAGLRRGDVILMLNNKAVTDMETFRELIETVEPGRSVALLIYRDGVSTFRAYTPEPLDEETER